MITIEISSSGTSVTTQGTMNFTAPTTVSAPAIVPTTTPANASNLFGAPKTTSAPATLTIGTGQASSGIAAPVSLSTATT